MVSFAICTANLQKTPKSPVGSKEIKPVNPEGNQPWIFIGRTDAEAAILWPLDAKSRLIGKDLDAGKAGRQEQKGTTEDEMVRWHHWLNGHEFGQTLGVGDGQACCSSWGRKESDTTERLNRTEFLGRKVMTNLDSILKSRDITLPTKVHIIKAMVFPVVTYIWVGP